MEVTFFLLNAFYGIKKLLFSKALSLETLLFKHSCINESSDDLGVEKQENIFPESTT